MNGVGKPCAGERHARFDRGPLGKVTCTSEIERNPKVTTLCGATVSRRCDCSLNQRPTSQEPVFQGCGSAEPGKYHPQERHLGTHQRRFLCFSVQWPPASFHLRVSMHLGKLQMRVYTYVLLRHLYIACKPWP